MLHILLWIVKIIGILLAITAGILLAAVVCVLFAPVRYTVRADGRLGGKQPIQVRIKAGWLLHIVSAVFLYPEIPHLKIRLFCFTLFDSTKKKKNGRKESNQESENTKRTEKPQISEMTDENPILKEYEEPEQTEANENNEETASIFLNDEQEQGFSGKIKELLRITLRLWKRVAAGLKNIEYTINRICDKIEQVIRDIRYYTEIFQSDVFQRAWKDCRKQLLRVLWMLKPLRCRMNLILGTGDPGSTGQIWSVYGILYPMIGKYVFLETDFENQTAEGDLYIKGRVQSWVLIFALFKLYCDKDIRRLLKLFKREEM